MPAPTPSKGKPSELVNAKTALMKHMEDIPLPSANHEEVAEFIIRYRELLKTCKRAFGGGRVDSDIRHCCKIILADLGDKLSQGVVFSLRSTAGDGQGMPESKTQQPPASKKPGKQGSAAGPKGDNQTAGRTQPTVQTTDAAQQQGHGKNHKRRYEESGSGPSKKSKPIGSSTYRGGNSHIGHAHDKQGRLQQASETVAHGTQPVDGNSVASRRLRWVQPAEQTSNNVQMDRAEKPLNGRNPLAYYRPGDASPGGRENKAVAELGKAIANFAKALDGDVETDPKWNSLMHELESVVRSELRGRNGKSGGGNDGASGGRGHRA